MKIEKLKGEFFFRAIFRKIYSGDYAGFKTGWELSQDYYSCLQEAINGLDYPGGDYEVIWPAEMIDRDCIYIPTQEELEEKK